MADEDSIVSIRERLLKERNALLDLSTRNRLLNTPLRIRNNRAIEIVDEKAAEIFRLLESGKSLSFVPGAIPTEAAPAGPDPDDIEAEGVAQPDEQDIDGRGVPKRHLDLRLQTRLTSEGLQKRLFDVWYDARTLEEEQGVNILYLAIGLLRWFDSPVSDVARHAPLVLLPVTLERSSAADRFKLKGRGEPPSPNLTLQARMKADFNLVIEDFADEDDLDLAAYCAKVAETVATQARWQVLPDAMVLGFFSFAKFLMYRDLDPENWPQSGAIDAHPLITALLRDGFPQSDPIVGEDAVIDQAVPALELDHVVDADSSQTVAIAEAAGGRTLVVKGPPGTGKSQTITNIIAAATARGRKVLFVAEKMAALDVVYRRLRKAGLGSLVLELHSNKINKRMVLDELRRTKEAALSPPRMDDAVVQMLSDAADGLNDYANRLHATLEPCGLTPHQIMGRLVKVQQTEAPAGFGLQGAETWTTAQVEDRRRLAVEIAQRLIALGPPRLHPWRGVRRDAMDPAQQEALDQAIASVQDNLKAAVETAQAAVQALGAPPVCTLADLDRSESWLRAAVDVPVGADRSALARPEWIDGLAELSALVDLGERRARTRADVSGLINDAGWTASYGALRTAVVTKGAALFRFLDGEYRAQIALLRSYLQLEPPKSVSARIALIDRIIAAQTATAAFDTAAARGGPFGKAWRGEASDWAALRLLVTWRATHDSLPAAFWSRLAALDEPIRLESAHETLAGHSQVLRQGLSGLIATLDLDLIRAFGETDIGALTIETLSERLAAWRTQAESLTRFIAFAARGRELARLGGATLVDAVHDGRLDQESLPPAYERAYAETLRALLFQAWPALSAFDGDLHDRRVAHFRQMDRARIEFAKEQIAANHAGGRPNGAGGIGPLGVLNAELAKKRAHLPIRQLVDRAGPAIQQLKPVFMMSPLSVAQFLKPGGLHFDLLVMDEASQIEPVDALGSVARVDQIVVVGDERQLPPTAFFKSLTGEDEAEDEDDGVTLQARDAESILDLCLAKGAPHRMLSWHYRSKHQSLIAVSNREFYENRLFIVPSPYDAVAGMGLKFHLLMDAPYERGTSRTNPREARRVAEAVMRHALEHPEESLGVATFSVAQRQTVLKELERLRRADPSAEAFFAASAAEPFFVKNLENIQGDERDVIFISVGYGKTEQGYLAHAFGPLSGEGGERRLNVLISRAKLRCEVFCNFTGADIDLERTQARGVAALKLFLTFAETGTFGLGEVTGEDCDSEFEAQICDRLRSLGHDVKAQIGASGFRVDLAIADPEKPGRFVLGIECDGAQYHASRSARDRDRLRQQVLEAHGWIIHRIWSADWYLRPQEELRKVEAAILAAKAAWRQRDEHGYRAVEVAAAPDEIGPTSDAIEATAQAAAPLAEPVAVIPYVEAVFAVDREAEPHMVPLADMAIYVTVVVEAEGPIHIDEIVTRIRILWGLQRAGSRVRATVERGAQEAVQRGLITGGPFFHAPGQEIRVRDRSAVLSASLRKPDMLPPSEIDTAVMRTVDANFGAPREALVQAVSRAFGFVATSAQLKSVLSNRIDEMLASGLLGSRDGLIVRPRHT